MSDRKWDGPERILASLGYSVEQARQLFGFLENLDTDPLPGKPHPKRAILEELFRLGGVEPTTCRVLAASAPGVEWHRLTAPPKVARQLLGVSNTSLMRYWHDGKMVPMLAHDSGALTSRLSIWWLHELLYAREWRKQHPREYGQGATWWPEGNS